MKWLLLLFSIFKPFFSSSTGNQMVNPIAEVKEMIKENAMKVVALFAAASVLATLFAAGIVMIAVDLGAQYDQNASIYFSSMIMAGLIVSILSALIAFGSAKAFTNEENAQSSKPKREELHSVGTSHPLQDALALLIHDLVKEREQKRVHEEEILSNRRTSSYNQEHERETNAHNYPLKDNH